MNRAKGCGGERISMAPTRKRILVLLFTAMTAIGLVHPPLAAAQGCSMCYQSAAAAGSDTIHALRNGIVILIVPPIFICVGITFLVYRRRNLHDQKS
jgi:hypothetical protein